MKKKQATSKFKAPPIHSHKAMIFQILCIVATLCTLFTIISLVLLLNFPSSHPHLHSAFLRLDLSKHSQWTRHLVLSDQSKQGMLTTFSQLAGLFQQYFPTLTTTTTTTTTTAENNKERECPKRHAFITSVVRHDPLIFYLRSFLTEQECADLVAGYPDQLEPSTIISGDGSNMQLQSPVRTSYSTFIKKAHNPLISCLEERVMNFNLIPYAQQEPFCLARYQPGQYFADHKDWLDEKAMNMDQWAKVFGQRGWTWLIYLTESRVEQGGATLFKNLGLKFRPRLGDAIVFRNVDANDEEDLRVSYEEAPVLSGEKWTLTIWQREWTKKWLAKAENQTAQNDVDDWLKQQAVGI